MADFRNIGATVQTSRSAATAALAVVQDVTRHLDWAVLDRLLKAALDPDQGTCRSVMKDLLSGGMRPEDIADFYIPKLARQLGDQWCADTLGFVAVTIGVSRLQMMLRELAPSRLDGPGFASIMLIVPQGDDHTLGAVVLAGQLRRKGFSVCLLLGPHTDEVAARIQQTQFQSVFISASQREELETLRGIVEAAKTATLQTPPIVIGGTILDVETAMNVTTLTGADHATKRPDEALKLCGLRAHFQDGISLMHGN